MCKQNRGAVEQGLYICLLKQNIVKLGQINPDCQLEDSV